MVTVCLVYRLKIEATITEKSGFTDLRFEESLDLKTLFKRLKWESILLSIDSSALINDGILLVNKRLEKLSYDCFLVFLVESPNLSNNFRTDLLKEILSFLKDYEQLSIDSEDLTTVTFEVSTDKKVRKPRKLRGGFIKIDKYLESKSEKTKSSFENFSIFVLVGTHTENTIRDLRAACKHNKKLPVNNNQSNQESNNTQNKNNDLMTKFDKKMTEFDQILTDLQNLVKIFEKKLEIFELHSTNLTANSIKPDLIKQKGKIDKHAAIDNSENDQEIKNGSEQSQKLPEKKIEVVDNSENDQEIKKGSEKSQELPKKIYYFEKVKAKTPDQEVVMFTPTFLSEKNKATLEKAYIKKFGNYKKQEERTREERKQITPTIVKKWSTTIKTLKNNPDLELSDVQLEDLMDCLHFWLMITNDFEVYLGNDAAPEKTFTTIKNKFYQEVCSQNPVYKSRYDQYYWFSPSSMRKEDPFKDQEKILEETYQQFA